MARGQQQPLGMDEIEVRLRAGGGVLDRRSHRDLLGHGDRLLRTGRLASVLPGVYGATERLHDFDVRLRAAALWAGPFLVSPVRFALLGHL